jgi:hypothetical protein
LRQRVWGNRGGERDGVAGARGAGRCAVRSRHRHRCALVARRNRRQGRHLLQVPPPQVTSCRYIVWYHWHLCPCHGHRARSWCFSSAPQTITFAQVTFCRYIVWYHWHLCPAMPEAVAFLSTTDHNVCCSFPSRHESGIAGLQSCGVLRMRLLFAVEVTA